MLQEKGLGFTIFAGAVAYADDLVLLLSSLNLWSNEFNSMGLRFNVSKCVAPVIGKTKGLL